MMNAASMVGYGLLLYLAIGLVVAIPFATAGIGQVLPGPTSFTPGARLLLVPGAAALWPYVLLRWIGARRP
jgi:hypothetical protein